MNEMARQSFRSWLFGGFYLGLVTAIENEGRYTRNHVTARLHQLEERLMTAADDMNAKLDRIDVATTNIAADIRAIRASAGMTQAEADALNARLDAAAGRLEAIDAENPEGQA